MAVTVNDPAVVFTRGGHAESEHRVIWCVSNADGEVLGASSPGVPSLAIFARSAVKPFQALPAVRGEVLERCGFDDRHLAVGCASHGATGLHLELITEMLQACGLTEADLGCGAIEPRDPAVAAMLRERGEHPSPITNNCSGKHALALALCKVNDWPADGYLQRDHPLERAMRDAVAEAAGAEPNDLPQGTDGCGMPTFHLPIAGVATAFARLACGGLGDAGDRIAGAMRAHPSLVAYEGAVDSALMAAEPGLVAKIGAEGVIGIGLADGRGLALKVLDGAMRALDPAAVGAAREILGLEASSDDLDRLARPGVPNSRGEVVGEGEARL